MAPGVPATVACNRVTPLGDIVALPWRGAFTGNRGILHRGREIVRFHAHDSWVSCALNFKDRHAEQWSAHHFSWLYFLDEAVALAVGHRPCGECRRQDYKNYQAAWAQAFDRPLPSAREMNRQLHAERLIRGTHRRRLHSLPAAELPDGVFVLLDDVAHLLTGDAAVSWTPEGYGRARRRPGSGCVTTITPPATIGALRTGYRVQIDARALAATPG